ncbi:MAG: hypothetical protein OES79_13180 [Planctomycetota bacterium]|nr:hypothetical protein [Planctomycetota bacterium]
MMDGTSNRKWLWTTAIVSGSIGIAMGALAVACLVSLTNSSLVLEVPVHAAAAQGQEGSIVATGPLENDVEYVAFLDAVTGDLRAAALNVQTNRFQAFYHRNIGNDFGQPRPKNPRFLMVAGQASFQRQANRTLAQSALYVVELSSGKCVAYALPTSQGRLAAARQEFHRELLPLDETGFRNVQVRGKAAAPRVN